MLTESTSSNRRLAALVALAALTAFVVAAVCVRVLYTGTPGYLNLVWNLVLAWVPFVVALVVYDGYRRRAGALALLAGGAIWLLFLPNAPYLVTDLGLLRHVEGAPVWFDVVLVSSAAWTGLLLGFLSLYLVHSVVRRIVGALTAWAFAVTVLTLSSFGIYLGHFQRWNSWDVFTRPRLLLREVAERAQDPLTNGRAVAVTVMFTVFLTLTYAAFYSVARLALDERRP